MLNSCHPAIKFTAEYSLDKVNFLHSEVIRRGNKIVADLYIKLRVLINTYSSIFSSCNVKHLKKSIRFSQTLRFNSICTEEKFFDNRCNQLECWLKDRD